MEIARPSLALARELAMVSKTQQATAEQGRQAVQLIEQAAAPPVPSTPAAQPGRLHIVA
jgi:hypothetical protein